MSDTESGQSLASWLMDLREWDAQRAIAAIPSLPATELARTGWSPN